MREAGMPAGVTAGGRQPRFSGFDVLAQVDDWDPVTAGVVLARMGPPPPIRFFTPNEEAIAQPLLDLLLDQDEEPRVPVLRMIDSRLAERSTDGWRYEDLPEDGQAWRDTLAALDEDARDTHGVGFARCDGAARHNLVQAVQDLGSTPWHGLSASRVWSLWTRYACTAFYSHPFAWNEIGFSGPAYPRGYKNAGVGRREPWEVPDREDLDPVTAPPGAGR
ncbi:MAG TPA: gluconate 2-dehydrogenase subunit 3 family protein [Pseudonocardiaceae bacterium]|nr:gluconate 2-dehydrogenase subunit 3 family protein [Pseudonocardiaceae bacterium]